MFDYTLHIDAYSPKTIPMGRLAEYMTAFADLLGHKGEVHFGGVEPGSTRLVAHVEKEAVPKVANDLLLVETDNVASPQRKAMQQIDDLLTNDNATGRLMRGRADDKGAEVIAFPGVTRPRPKVYGPIKQEGTLDGILVSVGGADKTVHIRLQNGDVRHSGLNVSRDLARRLAHHLFEPVRVAGTGRWVRDRDGVWQLLDGFKVTDFEVLEKGSIREAIDELRNAGSDWEDMDDPIEDVLHLRLENGPH